MIEGHCAPGFEPVGQVFEDLITSGAEVGATFAAVLDGQTVIDLRGGHRDEARTEALRPDDLFNIWSTAKGLSALCAAIAVDRRLFAYDQPVADIWPAFGVHGKGHVTIAMLLSHSSGINGLVEPMSVEEMLDLPVMAERLAAQAPMWEPGTASAYNANVFGHWVDALLRKTDGRGLGQFFREEVATPLGADVWIGLPDEHHHRRVAMVAPWAPLAVAAPLPAEPLARASLGNPGPDPLVCNRPDWIRASHGAAGGSANALGLARIYGALACGGQIDGVRVISEAGLAAATALQIEGKDKVLGLWTRWAAGFMLSNRGLYGPNPENFGHAGWGGSYAFADPKARLSMAYAMSLMGPSLSNDPRGRSLLDATYACLQA
jgi:CubicO group peptidase (beta-lactamase class C family)